MSFFNTLARRIDPRLWSNDQLRKVIPALGPVASVVNVSGWEDSDKEGARYRSYFEGDPAYAITNYPGDKARGISDDEDIAIDLETEVPSHLHRKFDVVFNHTVLEHVRNPVDAFSKMASMASRYMITVVPFSQVLHFEPGSFGDYYRFGPMAMRMLHENEGLTVVYESYNGPPASTVYLLYVACREPEAAIPDLPAPPDIEALRSKIGLFTVKSALLYAGVRSLVRTRELLKR